MDIQTHHKRLPTTVSNRRFGLTVGGILVGLAVLPMLGSRQVSAPLAGIGLLLISLALISPALLKSANTLWMGAGERLHRFVSPVLLGIVFFGVVTPMGLIKRLFNPDPLQLRFEPNSPSYWQQRPSDEGAAQSLRNQF